MTTSIRTSQVNMLLLLANHDHGSEDYDYGDDYGDDHDWDEDHDWDDDHDWNDETGNCGSMFLS